MFVLVVLADYVNNGVVHLGNTYFLNNVMSIISLLPSSVYLTTNTYAKVYALQFTACIIKLSELAFKMKNSPGWSINCNHAVESTFRC